MWLVVRYRRAQAITLAALACLITGCAVLAPLYDRAMQQALTRLTVDAAASDVTALRLQDKSPGAAPGQSVSPATHAELVATVPASIRSWFLPPIDSTSLPVAQPRAGGLFPDNPVNGDLLWRDGACDHLRFTSGRCPAAAGEIAVSSADVTNFGLTVGSTVKIQEQLRLRSTTEPPVIRLRVSGVYQQVPGEFWDSAQLAGVSGVQDRLPPFGRLHDVWVTGKATFDGPGRPKWIGPQNVVDLNLDRAALDVDRVEKLGPIVTGMIDQANGTRPPTSTDGQATRVAGTVQSGLPGITDTIREGRRQARLTVSFLMAQLGLLALFVLWLVLGVAIEQRRPELAVARLRGSGRRGAQRLLVTELLPIALVGVPLGALAALGLATLARHTLLRGGAPFELPGSVWVALASAALVISVTIWLSARQGTAGGVAPLLRRVPARAPGRAPGLADVVLASASGAVVLAFATGGLSGPLALAAPALLALTAGLVLAYLIGPTATWLGGRLLARGWYTVAGGLLATARRPATRRVVTVVTVASSLLVFSAAAVSIGARNRQLAADRDVGAAMVTDLSGRDVAVVRQAVASLGDSHATTVVRIQPTGNAFLTTLAVVPGEFRRVALLPDAPPGLAWNQLTPAPARPLTITGSSISLRASPVEVRVNLPGSYLELELIDSGGVDRPVQLGEILSGPARTLTARIPCSRGCTVAGLSIRSLPGITYQGWLVLDRVQVTGGTTNLPGRVGDWSPVGTPGQLNDIEPTEDAGGRLTLRVSGTNVEMQTMPSRWLPPTVPAILGGPAADTPVADLSGNALDGSSQPLTRVGLLEQAPGIAGNAAVMNLDVLQRRGTRIAGSARIEVWLDDENPVRLDRLRSALQTVGVEIADVRKVSQARAAYDASVPAWSLQLGLLTAVASLLIAALVIVLLAISTWRLRSRDLAGLGISGVPARGLRRLAVAEQIPVIVVAVLVGAYCGLVGTAQALPRVPLFVTPRPRSGLDFTPQWPVVTAVLAVELVILVAVGWFCARALARRARPERVREAL